MQVARHDIAEIADGIRAFSLLVQQIGVSQAATMMIQTALEQRLRENTHLL